MRRLRSLATIGVPFAGALLLVAALTGRSSPAPPYEEAVLEPPLPESVWGARILEDFERAEPLNSLIVAHHDSVLYEFYQRGMRSSRKVNVKSVSKSIMAALLGIALREGYLDSLGQSAADFFPDYLGEEAESQKLEMTLQHLVTMTTGVEGTSFDNYDPWVASSDWIRFALDQPVIAELGSQMDYSTGNSHLLSVIITRRSGMSTLAFARRFLFEPLGGTLPVWDRDPRGYYLGGNNMSLTPREMLAVGQLYLHRGMVGDRRVLDEWWVDETFKVRTYSPHTGAGYGYGWWHRRLADYDVWYALGYGGQFIFVVPELELTVAATTEVGARSRRRRSIYRIMSSTILPAIHDRLRLQQAAWADAGGG